MKLSRLIAGTILLAAFGRAVARADKITVAAAANLTYVLQPLDEAFAASNPGDSVTVTLGASGNLVAMIAQGAPYDVFLSADLDFPRKLIGQGGADAGSLVTFTYGKLVLWTTRQDLNPASVESVVRDPSVRTLAIANPKTAPYGRAAEETLDHLRLDAVAKPKLVFAENIGQTAQFVSSGNADAGFVALSLVLAPHLTHRGRWLEVPPDLYAPLAQGAILTARGAASPTARRYLDFLLSSPARAIFTRFGYGLPGK